MYYYISIITASLRSSLHPFDPTCGQISWYAFLCRDILLNFCSYHMQIIQKQMISKSYVTFMLHLQRLYTDFGQILCR